LTLNGSQLGGFLIFPEMSNFNSHPGIAGGLPKGNFQQAIKDYSKSIELDPAFAQRVSVADIDFIIRSAGRSPNGVQGLRA